jgi:tetratricopeptide (TPR) repeat protein
MPTNKKKKGRSKQMPTVDELLAAADHALLTQDTSHAIALYTQAIKGSAVANDMVSSILEKRAGARLSMADQLGALEDYQQALVVLSENINTDSAMFEQKAALHFYIGQLCEGQDALKAYKFGIDLLEKALTSRQKQSESSSTAELSCTGATDQDSSTQPSPQQLLQETQRLLASAYCSTAELYLTDLCFEENAEQECEFYIQKSLALKDATGESSIDALQAVSSLRLSQKRGVEAVDPILCVYAKLKRGCEALAKLTGLCDDDKAADEQQAQELLELDSAQNLPDFEFRCQTAKLLLECTAVLKEQSDLRWRNCAKAAVLVLGSLMAENDEVIEIWFLMGEANYAMDCPEVAVHYWTRTKEMLTCVQESLEQEIADSLNEEEEDVLQQQLDEVTCQLDDVTTKLDHIKRTESNEVEPMEE